MDQGELGRLRSQRASLDTAIILEKRDVARKKGLIVDSIEDLKCEKHPDAKFVVAETGIRGNERFGSGIKKVANKYYCLECLDGRHESFLEGDRLMGVFDITQAYDCNSCGIVIGHHKVEKFDDIGGLAGSAGESYLCGVCGEGIGGFTSTIS